MKQFQLIVQDQHGSREFHDVTSFVGEDASGSFGILAGHTRMITSLVIGLARFKRSDGAWTYVAVLGSTLYFASNVLTLTTRRYLIGSEYSNISAELQQQLLTEDERLHKMKASLRQLEDEVLKRLWETGRRVR